MPISLTKVCCLSFLLKLTIGYTWVEWPRSPLYWVWRYRLNMDISYTGFWIYEFSEWQELWNTKNWETADYEEPKFFRERSSFVPRYLRTYCDTNGIDPLYLSYYAAREDQSRNYSELRKLQGMLLYDNILYSNYVAFLYNVCNCIKGIKISQNCPDPCRKPNLCTIEKNVVRGLCLKVPDNEKAVNLLEGDFKNLYGSIYKYKSKCVCKQGYVWNEQSKTCEYLRVGCSIKRIGERVCRHNGKCVPVPVSERRYDFQILKCICTASWTGYLCTEPVNPCKYSRKLCGSFQCRRDETSVNKGYNCLCTKGFRRYNDFDPRCVNIDECQFTPCQHGGKCQDLVPDPQNIQSLLYNCTCIHGFTGENCEVPPKRPEWSSWSSWSVCSRTCGIGRLSRQRTCSTKGRCSGLSVQTTACILLSPTCDFISDSKQESQLKMSGIGWTAEEDRIIDDAFHWNEKLYSQDPFSTLHYLERLENAITIILIVFLVPLIGICLFNMILLKPRQWFTMTFRAHMNRLGWGFGGSIQYERRKQKRIHKKLMKNIVEKLKGKSESSDEKPSKKKVKINDEIKEIKPKSMSKYAKNESVKFENVTENADNEEENVDEIEEEDNIKKKEKIEDVILHVGK